MTEPSKRKTATLPDFESQLREQVAQRLATIARHVANGVIIVDPATTYLDADVSIGTDTVVEPNTTIRGQTAIGRGCRIGPNTVVESSTVGDRCIVFASVVQESVLENDVDIGPFSHLRSDSHLESEVHLGNFVEVKASRMGGGSKAGHFSYIGDAQVGANVNIGAGTVTCNYDGTKKHKTIIEDGVFIGSDTMLVAPVRIGRGASTGAGSVVTRDVPEGGRVAGMPARLIGPGRKTRGDDG